MPTIIQSLGSWTTAQVQLLTIPCYFLGAAIYMATAYLSDRLQMRGLFCVIFGTISVAGYAVLLADVSTSAHYFACFLVVGGLYTVVGLPLAWVCAPFPHPLQEPEFFRMVSSSPDIANYLLLLSSFLFALIFSPLAKTNTGENKLSNNTPRYGKKAVASGTQLTFGNAAGILSAFI